MRTIHAALAALLIFTAGGEASAGGYEKLAAGIVRAAGEQGLHRLAVAPFTTPSEGGRGEAAEAGRRLAEAMFEKPGTGVMDAAVLEKLKYGGRWAQALVSGEVYPVEGGFVVVTRTVDAKTGRLIAKMQAEIKPDAPYPGDLRDAPGGAASCRERLRDLQRANAAEVDLRARWWAAKAREPDFSYASLPAMPGGELVDYASMQKFYELLNAYYDQDAPVTLSKEEGARLKALLDREAAILRGCAGVHGKAV